MSAILVSLSDSPAIELVRLSSLILLILKYTISQYVGCTLTLSMLRLHIVQCTRMQRFLKTI